jgi:hypothetical protein
MLLQLSFQLRRYQLSAIRYQRAVASKVVRTGIYGMRGIFGSEGQEALKAGSNYLRAVIARNEAISNT